MLDGTQYYIKTNINNIHTKKTKIQNTIAFSFTDRKSK